MTDCVFCDIVAELLPSSVVYKDEICSAFMDIQPVNPGHVLVVSNQHAARLEELDVEMGAHLFKIAQRIARALEKSKVRCEGVNLFVADGPVAGQTVLHVHMHVIPRYRGDGFGFRFGPKYGQRPQRCDLDATAEQIHNSL